MKDNVNILLPTLKSVFGFDSLRDAQKPIVESVMDGHDILAILKTSGGKSLCFQLPAVHRGGLTLVISPLISLMKDQVDALEAKGIPAAYVNSNLESQDMQLRYRRLAEGGYRLFYVAPERFQDSGFIQALMTSGIHTIAIDEAHCASQWGHDFRPHYAKIGKSIETIETSLGKRLQRVAFTATATALVQEDICKILGLRDPVVHQQGFDRENLTYSVIPSGKHRDQDIEAFLGEHPDDCTIIYCVTVKRVEQLCAYLKSAGLPVDRYHGKLSPEEKDRVQDDFIQGNTRILISTSAFGMGVDKSDIRLVLHAQMPGSLEAWYQEAGRAGRDGEPSKAVLFYDSNDRGIHRFFIEMGVPPSETMKGIRLFLLQQLMSGPQFIDVNWMAKVSRAKITPHQVQAALNLLVGQGELIKREDSVYAIGDWMPDADYSWVDDIRRNNWQKVNAMQQWCETTLCRRWTVLKYFGDKSAHHRCGTCDTCLSEALSKSKVAGKLPYVRPITLMNFARAISSVGPRWKAVLLGTIPSTQLSKGEEPWYARFAHYALGDLERWLKRLIEMGLLDKQHSVTDRGDLWLEGKLIDQKLDDALCKSPEESKPKGSAHGLPIECLHKWRKAAAYMHDTSEMSIATEAFLRKIHAANSFESDDLELAGVPKQWIKQYGKSLNEYVEKYGRKLDGLTV